MTQRLVLLGFVLLAPLMLRTESTYAALGVVTAIPVGARPQTAALNPVTHRLYVAHDSSLPADSFVTVIDTLTNTVVGVIPVQKTARNIAVNSVTNRIYVANSDSNSIEPFLRTDTNLSMEPTAASSRRTNRRFAERRVDQSCTTATTITSMHWDSTATLLPGITEPRVSSTDVSIYRRQGEASALG